MLRSAAQRIVLASRPRGQAHEGNFRLEEMEIPQCPPRGVLLRALILSLDPYMRSRMDDQKSYATPVPVGGVMEGESVAEVIASDHPDFPVGTHVLARTGWQTHAVSDGIGLRVIAPDADPISTRLGVLGMPGFTAYAGLKMIGKPLEGETVVVAAATGPVGSLVGQLAKRAGARAVGIAGGPAKCRYLLEDLGFDAAVDHGERDTAASLASACPNGIDVYFENVGGEIWQAVLPLLNRFARVPVCGLISQFAGPPGPTSGHLSATMRTILTRSITMQGFINYQYTDGLYDTFIDEIVPLVREGNVRYREHWTEGLENAPEAFLDMLAGGNFGKALVRVG